MTKRNDPPKGTASTDRETAMDPGALNRAPAAQEGFDPEWGGVNSRQSSQSYDNRHDYDDQHVSPAQSLRNQSYSGFPASLFPASARLRPRPERKGHWAVAGGALIAFALAVAYLLNAAPAYTAYVDLMIDVDAQRPMTISSTSTSNDGIGGSNNAKPALSTSPATSPGAETASADTSANIENQIHIIGSALLLEKVFIAQRLAQDPDYSQPRQNWLSRTLHSLGLSTGRPAPISNSEAVSGTAASAKEKPKTTHALQRQALQRFAKSVAVERLGRSYVLRLSVTASNREKSARLATTLAQAYVEFNRERQAKAIDQAKARRDQQLSKLRAALEQAENRLGQTRRTYLAGLSNGSLIDDSTAKRQLSAVSAAAAAIQSARQNLNSINAARRSWARGTGQAYGAPPFVPAALSTLYLRRLQGLYTSQLQRHAALSVRLLPRHPRIQYVRGQLRATTRQIRSELGRIAANAQRIWNNAQDRVRKLAANTKQNQTRLRKTQDMRAKLAALREDVALSRQAISGFVNTSARTAAAPPPRLALFPGALILTAASDGSDTGKPKLISFLIVALITGLVLVLAYIVLAEQFFRRTQTHIEALPQGEDELAAGGNQNGNNQSRPDEDNVSPQRTASQRAANQRPSFHAPASQNQTFSRHAHSDISPAEPRNLAAVSALSADGCVGPGLTEADYVHTGKRAPAHTRRQKLQDTDQREPTANSTKAGNGNHTATRGNDFPDQNDTPHDQLSDIIAALGTEEAALVSLPARKFRKDIANLLAQLHRPQRDRSQIIVLQSPDHGDGHTALSLALALIGGAQNLRVLLIDADYKSRHLSRTFAPSSIRRNDVSNETAADPNDLSAHLIQDEDSGVHFLPLSALAINLSAMSAKTNRHAPSPQDPSTQTTAIAARHALNGITALAQTYDLTLIDGGTAPAPAGEASLTLMMRALINLADQVLVCDAIDPKANNRSDPRTSTSSAPNTRPGTEPGQGWQILSCKRVQGAPIVATVGEPA